MLLFYTCIAIVWKLTECRWWVGLVGKSCGIIDSESLCKDSGFLGNSALRDWQKRTEKNSNIVILRFYDLTTSFLAFGELWRYWYHAEAVTHLKSWGRVSSWRLTGKVLHCQVTRQHKSLLTLALGSFLQLVSERSLSKQKALFHPVLNLVRD